MWRSVRALYVYPGKFWRVMWSVIRWILADMGDMGITGRKLMCILSLRYVAIESILRRRHG